MQIISTPERSPRPEARLSTAGVCFSPKLDYQFMDPNQSRP